MDTVQTDTTAATATQVTDDQRIRQALKQPTFDLAFGSGLSLRKSAPDEPPVWSLRYRTKKLTDTGKREQARFKLGEWPKLKLKGARKAAHDKIVEVQQGHDPQAEKEEALRGATVREFCDRYLKEYAQQRKRSWKTDEQRIEKYILKAWGWGELRIKQLSYELIDARLSEMRLTHPALANRMTSLISKILRYALKRRVIMVNPLIEPEKTVEQPHERVLTPQELKIFWTVTESYRPEVRNYYRFLALTANRGQEVRAAKWEQFDLNAKTWLIPASVMKSKREHVAALSDAAMDILRDQKSRQDAQHAEQLKKNPDAKPEPFVFDGGRSKKLLTKEWKSMHAAIPADSKGEPFTPHTLRRTAATNLGQMGYSNQLIGQYLAHTDAATKITQLYNKSQYLPEKFQMADAWSRKLDAMFKGEPSTKIVSFAARA
jgi:integrase